MGRWSINMFLLRRKRSGLTPTLLRQLLWGYQIGQTPGASGVATGKHHVVVRWLWPWVSTHGEAAKFLDGPN